MYVCMHVCMHVCMYVCICMYVYVCMCMYMYVSMYMCRIHIPINFLQTRGKCIAADLDGSSSFALLLYLLVVSIDFSLSLSLVGSLWSVFSGFQQLGPFGFEVQGKDLPFSLHSLKMSSACQEDTLLYPATVGGKPCPDKALVCKRMQLWLQQEPCMIAIPERALRYTSAFPE